VQKQSLSITVDLEDWYHIPSVCGSPFSVYPSVGDFYKKWSHRYDYLSEPTSMVLDLLDEFRIKATFFIVADLVNHYPGLVESVARRGHEIACHGLEHSCKIHPETREPLISHREFEERTAQAKEMLEAACGEEVIGYRAPNVLVAGWMLDSLEKLGLKYDSSVCVNSLYNKTHFSTTSIFPLQRSSMHSFGLRIQGSFQKFYDSCGGADNQKNCYARAGLKHRGALLLY
jgi:hypothetical protein